MCSWPFRLADSLSNVAMRRKIVIYDGDLVIPLMYLHTFPLYINAVVNENPVAPPPFRGAPCSQHFESVDL